ncbi:MAG: hypothetical protein P4M13_08665 [Alphaproteobacteria bacterium]|nr:hypothetical protein [Alphaproteobacteria bacterium]
MKKSTLVCLGFFILGVALFLIQLWFEAWDSITFSKIMITDGVLFIASCVIVFLIKENQEAKKIHKDGGLD